MLYVNYLTLCWTRVQVRLAEYLWTVNAAYMNEIIVFEIGYLQIFVLFCIELHMISSFPYANERLVCVEFLLNRQKKKRFTY